MEASLVMDWRVGLGISGQKADKEKKLDLWNVSRAQKSSFRIIWCFISVAELYLCSEQAGFQLNRLKEGQVGCSRDYHGCWEWSERPREELSSTALGQHVYISGFDPSTDELS